MDFSFVRKIYWHQHGLSTFLDISQTSLTTCVLLEGWGFIGGTVQDPARVYGVLGLGLSCQVCLNLANMATLKLCP